VASPDVNVVDNSTWEILQETVYKTSITDMKLSTTRPTNGSHNDDMIQLGPLRSQSLFQFVQISDAYFCTPFLAIFAYAVINWIKNLANLEAIIEVK